MVPPLLDVDGHFAAAALNDHDVLNRGHVGDRFVGDLLERNDLPAAVPSIGGDEEARLHVVHAIAQRLGAEAAEHHAVDGADSGAGEHGDHELGNQRQVDPDAIAFLDPEPLQDVGERRDLTIQIEIGERAAVARFAFPDERGLVAPRAAHVAIEAVDTGVQFSADEPLGMRRLPVEDAIPATRPLQLAGQSRPERFGIAFRFGVDALVGDVGAGLKVGGRSKRAVFAKEVFELGVFRIGHGADSITGSGVFSLSDNLRPESEKVPTPYPDPSVASRARTWAASSSCVPEPNFRNAR